WTNATPYYPGHYRDIAVGNGVWVAVGHDYGQSSGGIISTTKDGITWSKPRTGGAGFGRVAFGRGIFVAVGQAGRVSISRDGETWADSTDGTEDHGFVGFINGEFLKRDNGGHLSRSNDGKRWTR